MLGALSPGRTILGIPCYSLLIVSAIAAAVFLCGKEEKRLGLKKDTVIDLALWLIPFGIIGARLYYVAFEWEQFANDPIRILHVWEGGIAIYGALLGGLIACALFAKARKLSLAVLADMIMPTVALAQAIGRWGNYFNMEAYGEVISNPALQFFPFGVLIPNGADYTWHLATFFYESVWDLGVFLILWHNRQKMYRPGDVSLWYVLLYGPGRGFIEGLRLDSLYAGGGFRISQWLSLIGCFICCCILLVRALRNSRSNMNHIRLLLDFSPCVLGIAALWLSTDVALPLWFRALPGFLSLVLLWCIPHKHQQSVLRVILASLLIGSQLLTLFFKNTIDPLLFTTLQTAIAGLNFTAVGYLLYPYSR